MTTRDVAVATMTRVRDRAEEDYLLAALRRLASLGLPVAVADARSSPTFRRRVVALPNLTIVTPAADGLVAQVQAAVARAVATGRQYVLYTEPDKRAFFDRQLAAFLRKASVRTRAGIVLAARSKGAFDTFPSFQRVTETSANQLCGSLTGLQTDYFYGPFLVARSLADLVATAPRTLGWGWRPYLFVKAHRAGHRIDVVNGDYRCPREQRRENDDDKAHRVRQLTENVRGLVASLTS